jgi:hypothetical protein
VHAKGRGMGVCSSFSNGSGSFSKGTEGIKDIRGVAGVVGLEGVLGSGGIGYLRRPFLEVRLAAEALLPAELLED